jgi:hypothetical protein
VNGALRLVRSSFHDRTSGLADPAQVLVKTLGRIDDRNRATVAREDHSMILGLCPRTR